MKEKLIRSIGSVCIILSLLLMFLPGIIKFDGVSKADLRESRKIFLADIDNIESHILRNVKLIEEDLEDNDLPSSKSEVREYFNDMEDFVKVVLNDEISLKNVMTYSIKIPKFLSFGENLLNTAYAYDEVMDVAESFSTEELETIVDEASSLNFIFYIIFAFFSFIIVLAVVGAITNVFNELTFLKYFYFALIIFITIVLAVCLPLISEAIADADMMAEGLEEMALRMSIIPYIALALNIVPIIIDIVLMVKNKKAKKFEQDVEVVELAEQMK